MPLDRSPSRSRLPFRVLVTALGILSLAACQRIGGGRPGSGTLKSEKRDVAGFTEVALSGEGELTLSQTGQESLTIEAEDNLLPFLTSTVAHGRLTLGTSAAIHPTKPIHYTVTVKDLTLLALSGAGSVTATQLHVNGLKVDVSGAGRVTLSGQAEKSDVRLSGVGSYDGSKLATRSTRVNVSGVGSAIVEASDALDATTSGVGSIEYIGDPKVTKSVSGVGSVHKR